LSVRLGQTVFNLLLVILLARFLGAESYGVYAYIFAIISILAIPTELGLPNLLVRYIAKYQAHEQWGDIKGLIKSTNSLVLAISSFIVISVLLVLKSGVLKFDETELSTLYWGLFLLPIIALGSIRGATLRGLRHIFLGLSPEYMIKQILFIIFLVIANQWLIEQDITPVLAMSFNAISALIAYIIGLIWFFKLVPNKVKKSKPNYHLKKWTIVAIPFLLTGGMQIINSKIDIVLLGWFSTSDQVGIYEVTWRGAALVSFGLGSLNLLLAPYFSRFYFTDKLVKLQKIATYSAVINFILGASVTLLYFFYGKEILEFFFGSEFVVGYFPLLILSLAHLMNTASGSVALLLNMTGHERKVLIVLAIAAFTNIFLNLILIPRYGIEGAAFASLITYMIWNSILVVLSIRYIRVDTSILSVLHLMKRN
jgi:O-antigen/teichoic acid export membrane protein